MNDLTKILNNPEEHYPGNFDTPQRANALLTGLCQDAATEIEQMQAEIESLNRVNAELVDALKELVYETETVSIGDYSEEAHDMAVSKARAALAKATGGTK
jgi:hypothetical protein